MISIDGVTTKSVLLATAFLALIGHAFAREIQVDTPAKIRTALQDAQPGDVILVEPGEYEMGGDFSTGNDGTRQQPITFAAAGTAGYARLHSSGRVCFRVRSRFWNIRGIHVLGDSRRTLAVIQMDGPGGCGDVVITDCKISGSRAYGMKASRSRTNYPNRVLVEHTELYDTRATGFDLVCGDDWVLHRNYVHDFGKGSGVAYGIFLKGGGKNGIVEGNFVDGRGSNGAAVGISFGGGLTGEQWLPLRDGQIGPEHDGGICRNNIVVHVSDAAYHANNAFACKFYNNLAYASGGFQRQRSYGPDPLLVNNVIAGSYRGILPTSHHNLASVRKGWFVDPEDGDFRPSPSGKSSLAGKGAPLTDNPTDYFGNPRVAGPQDLGPVNVNATQTTKWHDRRG